ncbi:DUF805 domain-containing protein [Lactiplantibacillus pentosus]|uniref:DUF805 domain-containing protein n=1 Tax=Lactiplantibacillus pentosus TaxID=1589 RepID=UPI000B539CBF|nr:DUF805 domain-containing protein [Lactiplantibacillus pentosus]ASG80303.1 hypothetical protein CEW82_10755 [Lactiplantibacillus pentosus]MDO7805591.1 DUF805 domain-containing protein [Lactiplantibacillus pentosus]
MNETKFCINCGKEIPANATFCSFCGADQKTAATAETQTDGNTTTGKQPTPPEHDNMWTALKLGMKQTFTWSQRITRPQYWWLYLDLMLIALILTFTLGLKVYSFPAFAAHVNVLQAVLLLIYSALMSWISVMQFTAGARRLHDSNRSAHYLWFSLIPIVGPILIIVFMCQRSKPAGERFDRFTSQPKPWTHKWWTWCLLVLFTLLYAGSVNIVARDNAMDSALTTTSNSDSTSDSDDSYADSDGYDDSDSDSTDTDSDTDSESDSSSDTDSITVGDDDIDISDQKTYNTSYSDSSWTGSTFKIDKVTVYKTDGAYTIGSGSDKRDFNGVVKVHMSIHAGRDISAYPTQAKLSTNDGQQVDADMDSDDFDGDLNSGTDTDGNLYFELSKLSSVKDITSIRLKWDASYDTDDYDDDNDFKTYDATLNLN